MIFRYWQADRSVNNQEQNWFTGSIKQASGRSFGNKASLGLNICRRVTWSGTVEMDRDAAIKALEKLLTAMVLKRIYIQAISKGRWWYG